MSSTLQEITKIVGDRETAAQLIELICDCEDSENPDRLERFKRTFEERAEPDTLLAGLMVINATEHAVRALGTEPFRALAAGLSA